MLKTLSRKLRMKEEEVIEEMIKERYNRRSEMSNYSDQRHWAPPQYNQYQQWAEIHPT